MAAVPLQRRSAMPILGLGLSILLVAVALASCADDSQDNRPSDGAPAATPTLTATELLAPQDVRDTFADLINLDASLLGETWTPDWTCDGIARALRIEAGVVALAGPDAADNPAAARAQDSAFGMLLLFEDWLVENDCLPAEGEAPAAPSTPEPKTLLGPQAELPALPDGYRWLYSDWLELTLEPGQNSFVDFGVPDTPAFSTCSNATCPVHFAWSVRQPFPSSLPLVEFFNERMGAHASLGAANIGQSAKGFFSPVSVYNRSESSILVEIRYVIGEAD